MRTNRLEIMIHWIKAAAECALGSQTPEPLRQRSFSFDERETLSLVETDLWAERFFDDEESIETMVVVAPAPRPLSPPQGGLAHRRDIDSPLPG